MISSLVAALRASGIDGRWVHGGDNADVALASVEVTSVEIDSRRVVPGTLFCCIRGANSDGHDFAGQAIAAGAVALLVEREVDLGAIAAPVPQWVVADTRAAVGPVAAAVYGFPARSMTMVGVTGTNGKTTVTSVLADVLRAGGRDVRVLGTLSGPRTTPEASDLQRQLATWRAEGADTVVMEVSSHALALARVAGVTFDVAAFTNLSQDHLDLHGDMEAYFEAKALLFTAQYCRHAVVNADDAAGRRILQRLGASLGGESHPSYESYSLSDVGDVRVGAVSHAYRWRDVDIQAPLGGRFNASNTLAVATVAAHLGVAEPQIAEGLARMRQVPGRLEQIHAGQRFDVVVDYAHTPDGLREVLSALRAALDVAAPSGAAPRLIVVFGCGGDRDRDKRPRMGAVAAEYADAVVITSDNPRTEPPETIINAVFAGVPDDYRGTVVTDVDRRRAMQIAFQTAQPGDVVLIAGKGHETTQTIGVEQFPFDDRIVARDLLENLS